MKYSELDPRFEVPDMWNYESVKKNSFRYSDILIHDEKFKDSKSKLRKELEGMVLGTLDSCENESDVSLKLDPVFEKLSKSYFMQENHVNEDLLLKKANKNTIDKKLKGWCDQLNKNSMVVKETPGTSIFYNKFKGVPCVVVAAGPSLGNSIELLREVQDKCLIMSVDTSFRSCYKRGIVPHFCNAHDANENGARFFKNQLCGETVGLFVNYIHPETIKSYEGPISFYYVGDDGLPVYKTMALACDKPNHPGGSFLLSSVMGGSSVAHTAYYLALMFGCSPITFIGLDLSYPDLSKSHFETDNPKNVRNQRLINVEDLQGRTIKTNLSFFSYKNVMEKMAFPMAVMYGAEIFNSTEDKEGKPCGIIHQGLKPISFRNFIDLYCTKKHDSLGTIKKIYDNALKGVSNG